MQIPVPLTFAFEPVLVGTDPNRPEYVKVVKSERVFLGGRITGRWIGEITVWEHTENGTRHVFAKPPYVATGSDQNSLEEALAYLVEHH